MMAAKSACCVGSQADSKGKLRKENVNKMPCEQNKDKTLVNESSVILKGDGRKK